MMDKIGPLHKARADMILTDPFFASLAMKLTIIKDYHCDTAWTDGMNIGYNPEYVNGLTRGQVKGLLAHEVLHCVCLHHTRRNGRNHTIWNVAGDYVINLILKLGYYELPQGVLLDFQYKGLDTDQVYNLVLELARQQEAARKAAQEADQSQAEAPGADQSQAEAPGADQSQAEAPGAEQSQAEAIGADQSQAEAPGADQSQVEAPGADWQGPKPWGEIRDCPRDEAGAAPDTAKISQDWQIATRQAAQVAHKAGKLPGIFKTFIEALAEPSVNWKDALRDFLTERNRNDYSWSRPSRRYAGRGVILPGLSNQTPPPLAVFVDTSGSVNHDMVKGFLSDIQGMTDHVSEMVVLWIDAVIQGNPVDIDCSTDITQIQPLGGGGTSFRPGFKWLAEQTDYEPEVVIYFTDGHCRRFPDTPPDLPVLWVLWERNDSFKPPFGEVITMI